MVISHKSAQNHTKSPHPAPHKACRFYQAALTPPRIDHYPTGISLHNFPEGIATFVTASSNLELGFGIALAVALHNIPEGLAVAGPVYAATGSKRTAILWAGISGLAEILGGVLAWLILGSMISPVVMAAIMAVVAGIMVALSVDELMPLAKEIDPNNNPSYGVLCGMSVMGFSLVLLQTAGIG